jgi:hypothetical protein
MHAQENAQLSVPKLGKWELQRPISQIRFRFPELAP